MVTSVEVWSLMERLHGEIADELSVVLTEAFFDSASLTPSERDQRVGAMQSAAALTETEREELLVGMTGAEESKARMFDSVSKYAALIADAQEPVSNNSGGTVVIGEEATTSGPVHTSVVSVINLP